MFYVAIYRPATFGDGRIERSLPQQDQATVYANNRNRADRFIRMVSSETWQDLHGKVQAAIREELSKA